MADTVSISRDEAIIAFVAAKELAQDRRSLLAIRRGKPTPAEIAAQVEQTAVDAEKLVERLRAKLGLPANA